MVSNFLPPAVHAFGPRDEDLPWSYPWRPVDARTAHLDLVDYPFSVPEPGVHPQPPCPEETILVPEKSDPVSDREARLPRSPRLMSRNDTALLVIDVQERLLPSIRHREALVFNIGRLIRGARVLGVPVAATEQYPRGLGPTVAAIAEGLADIPSKTLFSCGECPGIFSRWRMEGRGRVLVTGIEAHVCVAQTVLDLLADDWLVYVAVDAISSRFPQDMETALRRLECEGAILTTVEAALFEWCEQAGTSEFKQISRLVREELPRGKPVENSGPASSFT